MVNMNRLANCHNRFQGDTKKVLCVCSAGLLRSPTAAVVLSQEPFNYNTRAAGIDNEYALIPVDKVLIEWADEIVCMEPWQKWELISRGADEDDVVILDVPDSFKYRDPELMRLIKESYEKNSKTYSVQKTWTDGANSL